MQHESAAIAGAKPTSNFVEVNGLKLHYLDWGGDRTRTIVLCHGGSAHAHWWDYLAPLLRSYGRVIALDLRGHGRSQWAPSYGPAAHIGDLKAFLRDHMPTPVLLVGHSMGGEISQRIAFDCPELLEALVLVDSPHGVPRSKPA
jgi:pimeloyl-ACP methyl ester carboxylesterase